MDQNYFIVGHEIAERLREVCPGFKRVLEVLEPEERMKAATPFALVTYAGELLPSADRRPRHGAFATVIQRWVVSVVVSTAGKDGATMAAAGRLVTSAVRSLEGWKPANACQGLDRLSAAPPTYDNDGFATFPLLFEAVVRLDQITG